MNKWLALGISLVVTAAAAAIGSLASRNAAAVYGALQTPSWAPPSWLFGPVWTTLYVLMAIAAWLVWRETGWERGRRAFLLYGVQLVANALWSWLFFHWQLRGTAFVELLVLWLCIIATLVAFWRIRAVAGALLAPYLLWVSFAGVLNYTIWQMNRG